MFLLNNMNTYVKVNPGRIFTHFWILPEEYENDSKLVN